MKKYILKFKGLFTITCAFELILSIFSVGSAFVLKYVIDLVGSNDLNKFGKGIIFFISYCVVAFLMEVISIFFKTKYKKKTMYYIKEDIFSNLMKKDIKSFSEENSAKYISILSNDINMIEQDGIASIFRMIQYSFSFIIALISLISMNIYITLGTFILAGIAFTIPQFFSKNISSKRNEYSCSLEDITIKTKDILTGFEVIRNFNIVNKINDLYGKSNKNVETKKENYLLYSGIVDSISENLGMLVFTAPIAIGGYFVIKGQITIGTLVALIQLMNNIIGPIQMSSQLINKVKSLKPIMEKINSITREDDKIEVKYSLNSFDRTIELQKVDFSYDGSKKALKNINQTFEKGKKYALVGGSGSGKSTILRLLLRYYEEFDGSILIDGKEHRDIDINHIYKHLSVIQQNVFMFDGTVKDNIGLYGDYSDEEILKAAKMAGLSKLIESLPKGIYEDVGENGSRLSGGEKQRVAIARALMKNSSIMLLDESTSALDNETAFSIEKSLLELEGVTSIVITHKLMEEILKKYDEIIVMRDGAIVERGEFNELLSEKGYFYSLYNVGQTLDDEAGENSLAV